MGLLASIAAGLLSVAVLNLNHIRDIQNDKENNKITIPVMVGAKKAKLYHLFLIITSLIIISIIGQRIYTASFQFLFILPLLLLLINVIKTYKVRKELEYYPLLKQLSLSIFIVFLSLILGYFVA